MAIKTAGYVIEAITIWCPECKEVWDGTQSGSSMLTIDDLVAILANPVVACTSCGKKFRLPAVTRALGQ